MTGQTDTAPAAEAAGPRLVFGGLVASEALKAWSLRSTRWLVALAFLLPIGISVVTVLTERSETTSHVEAVAAVLGAVADTNYVPLLLLVSFGTLVGTAEYERGAAITTFAVVPRRTLVVLAKVVVVVVTAFVVSLVSATVSFLLASAALGGDTPAGLADPAVARVLAGTALFQAAAAAIALSAGLLLRSSIGAVAATLGFVFVLPALLQAIPVAAVVWFARTLPGPESAVLEVPAVSSGLGTIVWSIVAVVVWTAATVALACAVVQRRDV
jgi:ABC-2 type transport system permease protein